MITAIAASLTLAAFVSAVHAASFSDTSYDGARITAETAIAARAPGVTGVQLTISTPALAAPTQVQVFLPAGYYGDTHRRWPVTYYLHGAQGDDERFNAWYGALIGSFPSIVVAPSGGALGFYSDWYNGGRGGPPEYETYDIDQLVPLIDANFRTIAGRQGRALIGESMGGFGVMSYAAQYPDLFGAAVSMSGAVDTNYSLAKPVISILPLITNGALDPIYGPRVSQEIRWRAHNPVDLAGNLGGVALRLTTADGTPVAPEGPALNGGEIFDCVIENAIRQMNLTLEQRLSALGIPHEWVDYGAGCHTIWNFQRQFSAALPMLEHAFAHPMPSPPVVNYESIEPSFAVWRWQVTADPKRALEFLRMSNASDGGLTLTGSGTTGVVTPPFFRGLRAVDLVTSAGGTATDAPDDVGRLHFTVDLGPPHQSQEYTAAADRAGENAPTYFTTRTVTFQPYAVIIVTKVRIAANAVRLCTRTLGPSVADGHVWLLNAHKRRATTERRVALTEHNRCSRVTLHHRLRPGAYTIKLAGTDAFGHRVGASRGALLRRMTRVRSSNSATVK